MTWEWGLGLGLDNNNITESTISVYYRMVNHSLTETYDNDSHFDLTFIICVWVTFLPTVRSNKFV